ncbi:LacI family DNA-binding transcriptional regulator [Actinopolymorpha singaporensis]|uniref:LacI family DNA-binding transcriptional regulator n=1 Tax=Actinopolymorpha singaporensis TaxID=117157 RepID=UPI000B889934|nr:LacI family DNA-binding transcriptional regulator [Actinopolymorpha singaporensis]
MKLNRRRATQADVARAAGVSVATVSYVASGRANRKNPATPEVTARVLRTMRDLDYTPARSGRVLARSRTGLVAVAAYTPFNPWALGLITQIEEVAADHGLGVVIQRYGHTENAADLIETHLLEGLADAAVVVGSPSFGAGRLYRIGRRVPLLAVHHSYRPRGFDVMVQREATAVRAAAEHLIGLGVKRPAFIDVPDTGDHPRRDAFVDTFLEHRYRPGSIAVVQDRENAFTGFLDSRHLATELLDQSPRRRPDAIMASSDRAAIATMWAAMQLGISIPDELKVIGAGNIPEGADLRPALTTVGSGVEEFRPTLERLIARIDDPSMRTGTHVVPWRLILRDSA